MRTPKPFSLILAATLLAACPFVAAPAVAQDAGDKTPAADEKLPTPREIIDRFIKVTGGMDAYKKHASRTTSGYFEMPAMGMKGPMTIKQSSPNLMLVSIEFPGMGSMQQGYDGTVAWSIDPMSGPRLITGKQLDQMKREADFFSSVDILKNFESSKTVGVAEFAGEKCYQIKLESTDGITNAYYSVATGLALGSKAVASTPQGEIPSITTISEYKDFGGVKVPTLTVIEAMGQKQQIVTETVLFDALPASEFVLPDAIKTLVGAEDATAKDETKGEGESGS
jgi:hypothetical protein